MREKKERREEGALKDLSKKRKNEEEGSEERRGCDEGVRWVCPLYSNQIPILSLSLATPIQPFPTPTSLPLPLPFLLPEERKRDSTFPTCCPPACMWECLGNTLIAGKHPLGGGGSFRLGCGGGNLHSIKRNNNCKLRLTGGAFLRATGVTIKMVTKTCVTILLPTRGLVRCACKSCKSCKRERVSNTCKI
jgi:hypothetical protein